MRVITWWLRISQTLDEPNHWGCDRFRLRNDSTFYGTIRQLRKNTIFKYLRSLNVVKQHLYFNLQQREDHVLILVRHSDFWHSFLCCESLEFIMETVMIIVQFVNERCEMAYITFTKLYQKLLGQ